MSGIVVERRKFLRAAGAMFAAGLILQQTEAFASTEAVFATPFFTDDGHYGTALVTPDGQLLAKIPLPARGHDVVRQPVGGKKCVVFARRPGTFAVAFAADNSVEPLTFSAPSDRHFYGHGVFSADGKLIYATENDFDNGRGEIGIYDATDRFVRIGSFPSHGVGPHDIVLLDDGRTLAVANGGIETHPDYGRTKLNLASMQSSLVLIDAQTGDLLQHHVLPGSLAKISMRHAVIGPSQDIWLAGQNQAPTPDRNPLLFVLKRGQELDVVPLPDEVLMRLNGYVGSIAYNQQTGSIGLSSPEGGVLVQFSADQSHRATTIKHSKICGLTAHDNGFGWTTQSGEASFGSKSSGSEQMRWDNHMASL